jgi:hypothetical protein
MTEALHIPQQSTPSSLRCRHVGPEARRCGSPAMRGESFCYHHHQTRRPVENLRHRRARQATFPVAVPNSRADIQQALGTIMVRIAANDIDLRRAGLLLYALQIANSNLTHHQNQNAQPQPTIQKPAHQQGSGHSGQTTQAGEQSARSKNPQSHPSSEQECPPASEQKYPSVPKQESAPVTKQKCHPERSPEGAESKEESGESKELRSTPQPEPTSRPDVHYGSGPTPDLAHPQPQTAQTTRDFTPPQPVWRSISKVTGATLLEALARSEDAEPIEASPEDRGTPDSTRAAEWMG